jgi:hypothetical protein
MFNSCEMQVQVVSSLLTLLVAIDDIITIVLVTIESGSLSWFYIFHLQKHFEE